MELDCNQTFLFQKSFKREAYLDWRQYTTLVLKVRGDGRSYLINLSTEGYFDIMWNDIYHYVLYTRGGPHWQICKVSHRLFWLYSLLFLTRIAWFLPTEYFFSFLIPVLVEPEPLIFRINGIGLKTEQKRSHRYFMLKITTQPSFLKKAVQPKYKFTGPISKSIGLVRCKDY